MIGHRLARAARAALRELRGRAPVLEVTIRPGEPLFGQMVFARAPDGDDPSGPDDPGVDVDVPRDAPSFAQVIDERAILGFRCCGGDAFSCVCRVRDDAPRERGWMQTVSGRRFYPLEPRVEDVDVHDVAHGLAMCCRYAGHTQYFYSVAEHCVHVSRHVEFRMRSASTGALKYGERTILQWSLLALLHDSSEAYIGDMIRPLKHQPEMAEFRIAEDAIERVVLEALAGVPGYVPTAWRLIKEIDDRIIADEVRTLKRDPAMYADVTTEPLGVRLECWDPEAARRVFLQRYDGLKNALAASE